MNDTAKFLSELGDVPVVTDPATIKRKSRDMTASFSPPMRNDANERLGDVIVRPRSKTDVLRIASAAARARMPLMMRGGGTASFGQGIPLRGGAIVDMTDLSKILWTRDFRVRAEAGARLLAIDEVTRPTGWELRMHSSTKKLATIGGYVGGGHAGVGSCSYGILRDRGNIAGLEVISVEEEPRIVQLSGERVNLVHHAYGSNGIVTEVEMPLAPAWPWCELIIVFPDFMTSVRFAHTLATSDGIVKKLISLISHDGWQMIRPLKPYGRDGNDMVLAMVAESGIANFRELVRDFGGVITSEASEGQGPYRVPLYEFSWGHTQMHINREHPEMVSNIGLYLDSDLVGAIERSHRRFSDMCGMHFEVKRFDGKLSFQGSPIFRYVDDTQIADVMRGMREDGAMVANNHTFLVKEGGMKSVDSEDAQFKHSMDPYDLMNPGKLRFDASARSESAGGELPSDGWRYDTAPRSTAETHPL